MEEFVTPAAMDILLDRSWDLFFWSEAGAVS